VNFLLTLPAKFDRNRLRSDPSFTTAFTRAVYRTIGSH
jgi:hypothetical protein